MQQSWLFPILGLFPVALMQSCGVFFLLQADFGCVEQHKSPWSAAAATCQGLLLCRSCCPWALPQPGQEWAASEWDVPPLLVLLEVENMWRNIFFGAEADGSRRWTERTFLMCSHQTHWMSPCQDCTEFKGEENKWKSRMPEGSIRSDTPKIRETSGRNVSHTSLHVCKQWVLVKKDTDLAPDTNWVWYLWCIQASSFSSRAE